MNKILVRDFQQHTINLLQLYKDKTLLILIYNNACLGCTGRAIPLAYEFQGMHPELQVVGVHSNFNTNEVTEKEIKEIFTTGELPFPIFLDPHHLVYDQFESEGTPQWLLFDNKGALVRSIFGSQASAQNRLTYALSELLV